MYKWITKIITLLLAGVAMKIIIMEVVKNIDNNDNKSNSNNDKNDNNFIRSY